MRRVRPPRRAPCLCLSIPLVSHQILRLLDQNPSNAEMSDLMKQLDTNNDGVIDLEEFATVWWRRECMNAEQEYDEEIKMAFEVFDTDGDGSITVEELRSKLATLGEKMTNEEVDALIAHADKDGNGSISLEEFRDMECWGVGRKGGQVP